MTQKIFLLGATGFIGEHVLQVLSELDGVRVQALVRSADGARRVQARGAIAIPGELHEAGPWQAAAEAADVVIHLAQPATFGRRVTQAVARRYEADRLVMDRHLCDALSSRHRTRLVYVAGNSYYGETGDGPPRDEGMPPVPTGFGPYIRAAVHAVEQRAGPRLELVVAFPGAVYGRGSWCQEFFLDPISRGKPVMRVAGPARWTSPIHVQDCAQAIVHLALLDGRHLKPGSNRFFLVDDSPVTYDDLAAITANALKRELKTRSVPGFLLGLLAGDIIRSYMETDSKYSNAKLKSTGFDLAFPDVWRGIPSLVASPAIA